MEPPQMREDATTSNGFNRPRFLGRIAINCTTKKLPSNSVDVRTSSGANKNINRKIQESRNNQANKTKPVKTNKKQQQHHGGENGVGISFNASISSSVFEDIDPNITFWNPLPTPLPNRPSLDEQRIPSDLRLSKSELSSGIKNQENQKASTLVDHDISVPKGNLAGSLTNIESVSSNQADAVNDEDKLLLSSWGIPEVVLKKYHSYGIKKMFQWQAECLLVGKVLAGNNLVYSAPTSAGKTMVAELLMLKRVLETKKKAIMILPFVSVAHEKVRYLKSLFEEVGVHVGGFLGSQSPVGGFKSVDVAVCTIEKGNNLVNRLIEGKELDQLGIIVVDELHMVGDSSRGYLLELLLTKVLFVLKCHIARNCRSNEDERSPSIQIIGMSATLPNLPVIAKWLSASLYKTDFRPVPLYERVKINRTIFDCNMNSLRDIDIQYSAKNDTEHVVPLCLETVANGDGVLIFCPTKMWCEKLADTVAREFFNFLHKNGSANVRKNDLEHNCQSLPIDKEAAFDVVEQLKRCPAGLDSVLQKTIQCGVAYHHAGLTFDEREIVESAFRKGIIKVLIATSTLSSGVNLPARRVIIRTVMFHGKIIDTRTYKQMVGRAGRKGVDTEGESILMCKTTEKRQASTLMKSSLPAVVSSLLKHPQDHLGTSMKRAILEIIVSGAARKPSDVYLYTKCTLLSACLEEEKQAGTSSADNVDPVKECIQFLEESEFITLKEVPNADDENKLEPYFFPTQLGSAVLSSGLSPDEGTYVFLELQRARRAFVLENELHVLYLVTPIYSQEISANIDWFSFYDLWEKLSADQKRVAELVGIEESFLVKATHGRIPTKTDKQMRTLNIHKRFFTSLALLDLVQEMSLIAVSKKYKCNKGQLQSLQQSAATFAGMVTTFCARLGWTLLELIIAQFQSRLTFGIQRELCDLVRISLLSGQQARILFSVGYVSVASLASADPNELEHILRTGNSFESNKKTEDETEWDAKERLANRHCVCLRGMPGMTSHEAALTIIKEARQTIDQSLGGGGVQWEEQESLSVTNRSTSKKNNSIHRPQSNFTKFLKLNSQKSNINEAGPNNSHGSNQMKDSPVQQNAQQKSIILSPPPGFTTSQDHQIYGDPKDYQARITTLTRKDKDIVLKENLTNINLVENNDIRHKDLSLHANRDNGNTDGMDVNSACMLETIPPENRPTETVIRNPNESITMNTRLPANHSLLGRNSLCKRKSSHECENLPSINSPRVGCSKGLPLPLDDRKTDNPASVSGDGKPSTKDFLKFSPAQFPKSDGSITPTTHCEAQQLFTTSTPIDDEQLISDKSSSVEPDGRVTMDDVCTPVNNGICKTVKPTNTCSFTVRKIQPKQLISASSSHNNNNNNNNNPTECLEDGREIMKNSWGSENKNRIEDENDSIIMNFREIPVKSHMTIHSKPVTSEAMNAALSPECDRNGIKNKPGTANISSISDVFADSFVVDTQVEELMDVNVQVDQDRISKRQIPGRNVSKRKSDPSTSETSPLLFVEDSAGTGRAVTKTESGNNIDSPTSNMDDSFSGMAVFKELPIRNSEEKHFGTIRNTTPEELLPASNYERFGYAEDHLQTSLGEENDLFNSYDDLRIPYESGQEAVFVLNADAKQEQLEREKTNGIANGPESNLNLSNDDLFTPLPVDVGISILERLDKHDCDFDDFLKPMSPEERTPAVACMKVGCNPPRRESISESAENGIKKNDDAGLMKMVAKHSRPLSDSAVVAQPSSRKRKQTFSFPDEKEFETKAKKAAVVSKEKDSSPLSEQNLSIGSECFPPTPPDNIFSESLQLSPIVTPELFGKRKTMLKKPSQKRRSPRLRNRNAISDSENLFQNDAPSVHEDTNTKVHRKYCTRQREPQANNGNCDNSDKERVRNPSDLDLIKETAIMSDRNDVNGKENNVITKNPSPLMRCLESEERDDEHGQLDESKSIRPLCDASQHCSQNEFTIIDVCSNRQLFDTFISEWNTQKKYSLSIGCEKLPPVDPTLGIGGNFMEGRRQRINEGLKVEEEGVMVVGMAVCWNYQDSYYLSFTETSSTDDLDDSLSAPPLDPEISIADRLQAVRKIFTSHTKDRRTIVAFDVKSVYRVLAQCCLVAPRYHFEDPKIAAWMLNPGAKEKSFQRIIYDYLPSEQHLLDGLGGGIGRSSLGLTVDNPGSGRYRATAESVLVWHLMKHLKNCLQEEGIYQTFQETEMPVVCTVSRMELNGIGFSEEECEHLKTIMQCKLSYLEEKAYTLAGHPFSLSSIDDVSRVLFLELQLHVNGNPPATTSAIQRKTLGTKRGTKVHFSTSKETLEKLKVFHPLPGVILEWRRITNSLTKVVYPLQKAKVHFSAMNMHRIFGVCQLHTATGRISMFDPNLQNIPKDFNIDISDLPHEGVAISPKWLKSGSHDSFTISMRNAFIPLPGGVLIAADYSQLELRMIAHMSKDSKLINILNQDCDVFRLIASEWKNVSLEDIQNEERQQAKQICYGIIYGIGAKALGETLHVDENDAGLFIETFKSKYPGMKSYLRHLVEFCRDKGYIQTITGRKRYLTNITGTNTYAKAQAERQAVNSTIQGSAADLVKKAMINIEKEFVDVFPQCSVPHRVHGQILQNQAEQKRYFQQKSANYRSGAFLLLQIHDELLYEVAETDLKNAARIIQNGMENAMKLSVRMPVKLKCGHSWGRLEEFTLD